MKTLIFTLLLIPILFMWATANAEYCSNYRDVSTSDWYCPALKSLKQIKVLDSTKSTFKPADKLNRAEALKVLYELNWEQVVSVNNRFFDIKLWDEWFKKYFFTAYWQNLITEDKDNRLNASKEMRKLDFVVLLMLLSHVEIAPECEWGPFRLDSDFLNAVDFGKYICTAEKAWLITKTQDDPTVDRATAMQIIYNFLASYIWTK